MLAVSVLGLGLDWGQVHVSLYTKGRFFMLPGPGFSGPGELCPAPGTCVPSHPCVLPVEALCRQPGPPQELCGGRGCCQGLFQGICCFCGLPRERLPERRFPKGTAHIYSSLVFSVICSFYSIRFFQSEVLGAQRAEVTASSHTVLK